VALGSYVLGVEPSVALHGQRCVPRRLDEEGFAFAHEDLSKSLRSLLS
jgi:NAD dependent epimerase/dehydratase family enzyme